jgi:hypothetical protein
LELELQTAQKAYYQQKNGKTKRKMMALARLLKRRQMKVIEKRRAQKEATNVGKTQSVVDETAGQESDTAQVGPVEEIVT